MRILILGLNYGPEEIGIGPYTTGLCEFLAAQGHDVTIVCSLPYYPQWKLFGGYRQRWTAETINKVHVVRCPIYIPAKPSGMKRILHHFSFGLSALLPMLRRALRTKPEVILSVAPSLIASGTALLAARVVGCKTWLHVQDFEVEAAFATGLLDGSSRVSRFAYAAETKIMGSFDMVSTISPEMCRKLAAMGIPDRRIVEFRNWAADFTRLQDKTVAYRELWKISTPYVALYSGNISNKQGIEIIVETARLLRHRADLSFVICGEGPSRGALIDQAAGLENVHFHSLQPLENLPALLGMATLHLLPQLRGAADLVLPSKLPNMLASGAPVIATAEPGTGLAREIQGCGIAIAPEDAGAMAEAIEGLLADPERRSQLGQAGQAVVHERWQKNAILRRLERRLSAVVVPAS